MNSIQAKQIADYLHTQGINPKEIKGSSLWYYSPFRNESTASFKVDNDKNIWYDHGLGEGGNILDLVKKLHNISDISSVLSHLSGKAITTRPVEPFSFQQQENSSRFEDISIQPLNNPMLIQYLKDRKINIPLAQQLCKEIHYKAKGKPYFAIGFENDKGGFALRNEYSKICTSSEITSIDKGKPHCCVFEGFIDYLSFLTLKNVSSLESNIVILNSVNNLNKATEFLNLDDDKLKNLQIKMQNLQSFYLKNTKIENVFSEIEYQKISNLKVQSNDERGTLEKVMLKLAKKMNIIIQCFIKDKSNHKNYFLLNIESLLNLKNETTDEILHHHIEHLIGLTYNLYKSSPTNLTSGFFIITEEQERYISSRTPSHLIFKLFIELLSR